MGARATLVDARRRAAIYADVYGGVATFDSDKLVDVMLEEIDGGSPGEWPMEWAPDDMHFDADAKFAA